MKARAAGDVARAFFLDLWKQLPFYLIPMHALGMANIMLTNLDPPDPAMATTVVIPLSVFALVQELRLRALGGRRVLERLALWGTTLGLPILGALLHRPNPMSHDTLLAVYEFSNLAWVALLVLWVAVERPASHLALYFGVLLLVGTVLENGGIVMGYFHEQGYRYYLPGFHAPLATQLGWCMVMIMGLHVVFLLWESLPSLRFRPLLSALLGAVAITSLDVQIDPLASRIGCWVWSDLAPPFWFDVPLINYAAWICALVPTFSLVLLVARQEGLDPRGPWTRRALLKALAWSPVSLLSSAGLFALTMTVLEGGPGGPSWQIFRGFLQG